MCVNSRDAECDVRLLYLHGVGDDGTRRDWWPVLQQTSGSDLGSVDIYAPDYSDLLDGRTRAEAPHRTSFVRPHFHLLARRQYRARQSDLHSQLLQSGAESLWPYRRRGFGRVPGVLDAIGEKFVLGVIYDEVGRYVRDDQLRRSIRERVLEVMPTSGRIVIVGHSLGALIALDLLHHLPGDVEIPILITAASSLARRPQRRMFSGARCHVCPRGRKQELRHSLCTLATQLLHVASHTIAKVTRSARSAGPQVAQ